MELGSYLLFAVGGGFIACSLITMRKRAADIRALARILSFVYVGDVLPPSLNPPRSELAKVTAVWNAIEGERDGRRIVAFDCRVGPNKGGWRHTVIAVRGLRRDAFCLSVGDLQVDQVGEWVVLYRPRKAVSFWPPFMPVAELRAHLELLGAEEGAASNSSV